MTAAFNKYNQNTSEEVWMMKPEKNRKKNIYSYSIHVQTRNTCCSSIA